MVTAKRFPGKDLFLLGIDHASLRYSDEGLNSGVADGTTHRAGADGEGAGFTMTVST
jgi:hypothetical protein